MYAFISNRNIICNKASRNKSTFLITDVSPINSLALLVMHSEEFLYKIGHKEIGDTAIYVAGIIPWESK